MTAEDEELIRLAQEALAPQAVDPPLESIVALREAVDRRRAPRRFARRRAGKFRLATAAAAFLTLASGTAAASALSGASLPAPLRGLARGMGLPVDSAGLARAKSDAGRLSDALRQHDVRMIGRDAAALETTLGRLDPGDRRSIDGRVDTLLNQAAAYSGEQPSGSEGPGPAVAGGGEVVGGDPDSSTPTTTVPATGSGGGGSTGRGDDRSSSSTTSTTSTVPSGSGGGSGGGSDGGSVSGTSGA